MLIVIPGKPQPKERPRFNRATGKVYTPKATKVYEQKVVAEALAARCPLHRGHLAVSIALFWPDKRRRDVDNGVKAILDGLNGRAWRDDAQIVQLLVTKRYDKENPRAEVVIEEVGADELYGGSYSG